ncbi:MAG: pyruvate ferredoxin oxidoreductase [Candidatus Bathyarchaeia archaeon]
MEHKNFEVMTGNKACAWGVKLSRVQVASIYPVTPQTTIGEYIAEFIAKGELNCELVNAEGELSTQAIVKAASRVGARTFVCTSGPGQLYMHHPMHGTSSGRLPVVMATVHRGNKGMQPDHTDLMSQLWTGWIQWYCENNQEVLDSVIMAYRTAEDKRVRLPIAIGYDGYILSYTSEPVEIPDQAMVDEFLPPYEPIPNILPDKWAEAQTRRGAGMMGDFMSGGADPQAAWRIHHEAILNSKGVIKEVNEEFGKRFGRKYGNGLVEEYRTDDAEAVVVAMGTIASTARVAIDRMRSEGKPVGLVKLKTFVPFPTEDFQELGKRTRAIGMIDRNVCLGLGGAGFGELRRALYDLEERPRILGFYAGLAGAEVRVRDIEKMAEKTLKAARGEKVEPIIEWAKLGGGE